MLLLQIVENTGDGPYGIDQQDSSKAYALTCTMLNKVVKIIRKWQALHT